MMKCKRLINAIICIIVAVVMSVLVIDCFTDPVDVVFSWIWSEGIIDERCRMIAQKKNWYKCYFVTKDVTERILRTDFTEHHFSGCKKLDKQSFIDAGFKYFLSGNCPDSVLVNTKRGADEFNKTCIYVNRNKNVVVLYFGETYGR